MTPVERFKCKGFARDPYTGTMIEVKVHLTFQNGMLAEISLVSPGDYTSRCSIVEALRTEEAREV